MTYFYYDPWKDRVMAGLVDWEAIDVVVIPCMTSTTAASERDAATIGDLTLLDELDGPGYSRQAMAALTNFLNTTDHRVEVNPATGGTYGSGVGQGTRQIAGLLYIEDLGGSDSANRLIAWNDQGFPQDPGGGSFTQEFDPTGAFRLVDGS